MKRTTKLLVIVATAVSTVAFAGAGWAYWTTGGSGSASASVGTLSVPGTPAGTASSGTVSLGWSASTVSGGGLVKYHLERSPDSGTTWTGACSSTAVAPISGASCLDTPGAGTYKYRVTALYRSWTAVSGLSNAVAVSSIGPLDHFLVAVPSAATAGTLFDVTVTAQDASNNTVSTFAGLVHFTSTDGQATSGSGLPADYTFTSGAGFDNGVHVFTNGVTLKTAGSKTVLVSSGGKSGTSATITVSPATAHHFAVTTPASATAGASFNTVTLAAQDLYNNTATSYANGNHTIAWSGAATSPAGGAPTYPTATVSFANGTATTTLTATLFSVAGPNVLTASATSPTLTGSSASITVSPATAHHFAVTAPATATAGTPFSTTTLTAQDLYNNTATGYSNGNHTIVWSGAATSPAGNAPAYPTATVSFTNGVSTTPLSATLFSVVGPNVLTASATTPTLTGSSASVSVTALTASRLAWTSTLGVGTCYFSCSSTSNFNFKAKVSLTDTYGNPVNAASAIIVTLTKTGSGSLLGSTVTIASGTSESSTGGNTSGIGQITFSDNGNFNDTLTAADGGVHTAATGTFTH